MRVYSGARIWTLDSLLRTLTHTCALAELARLCPRAHRRNVIQESVYQSVYLQSRAIYLQEHRIYFHTGSPHFRKRVSLCERGFQSRPRGLSSLNAVLSICYFGFKRRQRIRPRQSLCHVFAVLKGSRVNRQLATLRALPPHPRARGLLRKACATL